MVAVSRSRPGERRSPPADPPVSNLMTCRVVAVVPATSLVDALRVMDSAGVRHLPVVEHGRCVGLLTEIDLLRRLVAEGLIRPGPAVRLTAGVICRRPAPAIALHGTRADVARAMLASGSDAVLVLDDGPGDGRVLGIVTASDLAASLAASQADEHRGG